MNTNVPLVIPHSPPSLPRSIPVGRLKEVTDLLESDVIVRSFN